MEKVGYQTWNPWFQKRIQRYGGDCAVDSMVDGLAKAKAAAKIKSALARGFGATSDAAVYFVEYPDGTMCWFVEIDPEFFADG